MGELIAVNVPRRQLLDNTLILLYFPVVDCEMQSVNVPPVSIQIFHSFFKLLLYIKFEHYCFGVDFA